MNSSALIFGAGGALGTTISDYLQGQGFELHTAGTAVRNRAASHVELTYDEPCNAATFSALPELDAVVWAQGINISDTVASYDCSHLQRLIQGNVLFIASSIRSLLMSGRLRLGSRLVVVSSIWQLESRPGKFSYSVSKAALQGLVKSCALDLGPHGILINAVLPGVVDTPMTRSHLSAQQINTITSATALGRLPEPTDIATAVGFLASSANRAITGQFLTVDCGFVGLKLT